MTTAAEPRFGARGQRAAQVRDDAVTEVLARCKAAMRNGVHATHVAAQLRAGYGRLAMLAAAVEVIEDEHHDPIPFVPESSDRVQAQYEVERFGVAEPVRTTIVRGDARHPVLILTPDGPAFTPLTPPRNRTYTPLTPAHSRRARRG